MSWFLSFEWDDEPNIKKWNVSDAEQWLEKFRVRHHYDEHTGLQSILYNFNKEYKYNNFYVRMECADMYFGFSDKPHQSNVQHFPRLNEISPDVREYFKHTIPELYKVDYEWMKNLNIWEKSS